MLSVLLLTLGASALQPSTDNYIGVEPERIRRYHVATQHRLRQADAWQDFVAGIGGGWQARFDERTGRPHRAWGPGIELGTLNDIADVERALRGVFAQSPALLGADLSALKLGRSGYVAHSDTWLVQFDQVVADASLWRGGVMARIKQGRLIMFGADTLDLDPTARPGITATSAQYIARSTGPAGNAPHSHESVRLVWLAVEQGSAVVPTLAWETRSRTEAPVGHWVSFVDAQTGTLLGNLKIPDER